MLEELVRSLGSRVNSIICVLVRAVQRNRPMRERERVFQELANIPGGLVSLQSDGVAGRLETQGRAAVQVQREHAGRTPSCSGEISLCSVKVYN